MWRWLKKYKSEFLISLGLFVFVVISSFSLPFYSQDKFYIPLFSDKIEWYDGLSPLIFHFIRNYQSTGDVVFSKNYTINGVGIGNFSDVVLTDGNYQPAFYSLSLHGTAIILSLFKTFNDLHFYKLLIAINGLLYSIVVVTLYHTIRELTINKKIAVLISLIVAIGTGFIIYSKYLFLTTTLQLFFFSIFLYLLVKFLKKEREISSLKLIILAVPYLFFAVSFQLFPAIYFLIVFIIFIFMFNWARLKKPIILILILFLLTLLTIATSLIIELKILSSFRIDRTYHQLEGMEGLLAFVYSLTQEQGNALFVKSYSLFGYLFSPKGLLYNSPFLLFSIGGIILFKQRKIKYVLLFFLIFYLLAVAYLNPGMGWTGGYSPRYVRHAEIPILILSIFVAHFIQNHPKRIWVWFFTIAASISILNSTSLAIRTDWNYERDVDLVSPDLALFPWIKQKTENTTLYLFSKQENARWVLSGERYCKAFVAREGIATDPCDCILSSNAYRAINLPWKNIALTVEACAKYAGGDGTIGYIFVDDIEYSVFVPSNGCKNYTFNLYLQRENPHIILLKSSYYNICNEEMVYWKQLTFSSLV